MKNGVRSFEQIEYQGNEKNRECLKCKKNFISLGNENRLCKKCNLKNEGYYKKAYKIR